MYFYLQLRVSWVKLDCGLLCHSACMMDNQSSGRWKTLLCGAWHAAKFRAHQWSEGYLGTANHSYIRHPDTGKWPMCVCVYVCISNRSVFITSSLSLFLPEPVAMVAVAFYWDCPPPCYQHGTIIRCWLHTNNQLYNTPLPLIDQQSWSRNYSSGAHRAACSWTVGMRARGVKEYSWLNAEY